MLVDIEQLQMDKYSDEEYEVFDKELQQWVAPSKSCYHNTNIGFPHSSLAMAPITMIQIYDNFSKQYIVLGRKDFTGSFDMPNVKYIKIENEALLLKAFIKLLNKMNPSIISGWNSMTFDMPYITNRVARVLDGFKSSDGDLNMKKSYIDMPNVLSLSPVGSVYGRKAKTKDGMEGVEVFWQGISLIDYRELTIKYGYLGLPSYSLAAVAKHFGLAQKIDHSQYSKFDDTYTGKNYFFPLDKPEDDAVYNIQRKLQDIKDEMEKRNIKYE